MHFLSLAATLVAAYTIPISAGSLNINNDGGIQSTTKSLATNLMSYHDPTTGLLPAPYYWWEAGGMWGGMLEYWHYTGDATYNAGISTAIVANVGAGHDFMGPYTDGNDDQGWWALTAMSAADYGLPMATGDFPWISMVQNAHGEMVSRWDMTSCNGGLKWKLSASADYIGYHYKSTIANALFFQLSARLYRATGNQMYADWAEKIFEWVRSVGLIDAQTWAVYDGTDDRIGCSQVDHDEWSYTIGVFLYGSAIMQAHSSDPRWETRTNGLLGATSHFFQNGVMVEKKCEPTATCDTDQLSFKAYLSRYMAATMTVLPSLQSKIMPLLKSSAGGAAASCGGGPDASTCGMKWTIDAWDNTAGVGQQLAALEVVHGLLAPTVSKVRPRRELTRRFGR